MESFTFKRRIQLIFLFNLMLISGLAEAFSMACDAILVNFI